MTIYLFYLWFAPAPSGALLGGNQSMLLSYINVPLTSPSPTPLSLKSNGKNTLRR